MESDEVPGTVYYHPLVVTRGLGESAIFSMSSNQQCPVISHKNQSSSALLWTKEIPCSCLEAVWLQDLWLDSWPKTDAFPNITQVYLGLSPPLSLHMSPAFEDGFISSSGRHHALFTLGIDIEDTFTVSPVLLGPSVSCSQMASRQILWAVFGSWPSNAVHMISRVVRQETDLPVLGTPSTWALSFTSGKEASLLGLSGWFRRRHSAKCSGTLL